MPPKARPNEPSIRRRWLLKCGLVLALVVLFIGGVIWAGRWAREQLHDRNPIDFADIECDPPAGMDRHKFLDEVRYYASPRLPEKLDLLDEELRQKLTDGFARHPWIEKVDEITIAPPKRVAVQLTPRTPVLAVKVGSDVFAVDAAGIVLPKNAATSGLPVFTSATKAPRGIGERWGDPNVEAAARRAKR